MAATEYHHGVRVIETTGVGAAIRVVSTAVIGLVATAPDADNEAFPINTLCCSPILRAASARQARAAPWPKR